MGRSDYIGTNLVTDNDRDSYRAWLLAISNADAEREMGWEPKPGDSDDVKRCARDCCGLAGYDGAAPGARAGPARLRKGSRMIPPRWTGTCAFGAMSLAALNGGEDFDDRVMAGLKNPKSPQDSIYFHLFVSAPVQRSEAAAADFGLRRLHPTSAHRTRVGRDRKRVCSNPAGQKLAWDFVLSHWDAVQKSGGPFASGLDCGIQPRSRSAMPTCAIR